MRNTGNFVNLIRGAIAATLTLLSTASPVAAALPAKTEKTAEPGSSKTRADPTRPATRPPPAFHNPINVGAASALELMSTPATKRDPLRIIVNKLSVEVPSQDGPAASGVLAIFIPVGDKGQLSGRHVEIDITYVVASSGWTEGRIVALTNGTILAKRLPKPPVSGVVAERLQVRLTGDLVVSYGGVRLDLLIQALARGSGRAIVEPRLITLSVH